MPDDARTRRRFLALAGVGAIGGIAGCTTGFEPSSDGNQSGRGTGNGDGRPDDTGDGGTGGRSSGDGSADGGGGGDEHTDDHGDGTDGHGDAHGAALDGPSASATVTMTTTDGGSHFEPHVVWIEPGGTVTWELDSGSHTTTAYAASTGGPRRIPDGADAWESGTLSEAGAAFEHTFETEGVYDYFCVPHEATGMLGSVVVGRPAPDGQPGLREPQGDLPDAAREKLASLNERVTEALDGSDGSTATGDGHADEHADDGHDDEHADDGDH